jgi:hypothetical protein
LCLLCREMPSDAEPVASRARAQLVAEFVAVSFRFGVAEPLLPSKSDSPGLAKARL